MEDDKSGIFQMRFPQKLWYLLNLRTDAILWGGTGQTILLNYRILHKYLQCDHSVFKTTNISSFVRQLNLYGFRKVTSHLQDPLCNSSNPYMHEYVHDYFQFGRPELLNKITRKALTIKKSFKPKGLYSNAEQALLLTPLQKARRALRLALKKAAQDLYIQHSPNQLCNLNFGCNEESPDDYAEGEENIEFDWLLPKNEMAEKEPPLPAIEERTENESACIITTERNDNYGDSNQESLITFNDVPCQQNNDQFPNQFLSMPDLDDQGPSQVNSGVELLAEFDIDNDNDQGIITKKDKENDLNSLNCVLPSISNDPIDDVSMAGKDDDDDDDAGHYHGEWDQMFNDIISNKSSSHDCGSDMKELYSQISRTIDLLNS